MCVGPECQIGNRIKKNRIRIDLKYELIFFQFEFSLKIPGGLRGTAGRRLGTLKIESKEEFLTGVFRMG